jgi:hypothetical protein
MSHEDRLVISSLGIACWLLLSASASAQTTEAAASPPPQPSTRGVGSDVAADSPAVSVEAAPEPMQTPPASAAAPTTLAPPRPASAAVEAASPPDATPAGPARRVHDGFYLRMGMETGTASVKFIDAPDGLGETIETSGGLKVMLGGTPSPGMVFGGGLWAVGFDTNKWHGENRDKGSGILFAIGPFIDYFPDPKGGFHLGGSAGVGGVQIDAKPFDNDDARMASGSSLGAFVGYDFWVSQSWSLGIDAHYMSVRAKHPDGNWKAKADSFGLGITGLYY